MSVYPRPLVLRRGIASLLVVSTGLIVTRDEVRANVDNAWTGTTSTDWNTGTNWSLGHPPTNTSNPQEDALINISTGNILTINSDITSTPTDIFVGRDAGSNGRLNHPAGIAGNANGNWVFVGVRGGTGRYDLGNSAATGGTLTGIGQGTGTLNVSGRLWVGGDHLAGGGTGLMNVNTSGTLAIGNDLGIGSSGGTGVMNIDAGTVTTGGWNFIGKQEAATGGNGTLKMSGGVLTNNGDRTFIGLGNDTGSLQMSGGTYNNVSATANNFFAVGVGNLASATTSTVTMAGGTLNVGRLLSIGGVDAAGGDTNASFMGSGKGGVVVSNAGALVNATGEIWIGQGAGSIGTMTVSAGKVSTGSWIAVGRTNGTGTLTISGGTVTKTTANGHLIIGSLSGSGTLTQTGGLLDIQGGSNILVGEGTTGTNTYDLSGGTANANSLVIGFAGSGQTNTVKVSGASVLNLNSVAIAPASTGTLQQTGGTINVSGGFDIQASAAAGTFTMSAGILKVDGSISTDNGTFGWTGGTISRSNGGAIAFSNGLIPGSKSATLGLNADKTFTVGNALDITAGLSLDVTGLVIPSATGFGSFTLGTVGSIVGTFTPANDPLIGLSAPANATYISEAAGESGSYNAATQSVYWVQENGGAVTLKYSVVPEPGSGFLILLAGSGLALRRRRS